MKVSETVAAGAVGGSQPSGEVVVLGWMGKGFPSSHRADRPARQRPQTPVACNDAAVMPRFRRRWVYSVKDHDGDCERITVKLAFGRNSCV